MVWASVLLMLVAYFSGSFAQTEALRQPPSVSVSLGKNAQITCSGELVGEDYVSWYQQKPGMAPVLIITVDDVRPSGISDRYSGSKSGNTATLTISRAKAEDEADYHCQVWDTGADQHVFGGGTTLTISGQPTVAPSVHVFPPSKEELDSKDKATLVCLLQEFYPAAFQVTWVADGTDISNGVETTKSTKVNDKYVASSYLTVSASDWKSHESFSCKVTHEGSSFVKSVSHSQCP